MKPSELFLGARQFFGALVPGCIWVMAVSLWIFRASLHNFVLWKEITVIQVGAFLGISFLVGMIFQPLSFRIATYLASTRLFVNGLFNVFRWEGNKWNAEFVDRVTDKVKIVLEEQFPHVFAVLRGKNDSEWYKDTDTKHREESFLFEFCKKSVVERSERLGKKLEENEGDINLVASVPLPLILLTVALTSRANQFPGLNLQWGPATWRWLIPIIGLVVVCMLLFQLHEMIKSERRTCFEIFLTLTASDRGRDNIANPMATTSASGTKT